MINIISLSILAGIAIGLAGTLFLNAPDKLIGSLMFSVGLLTIFINDLKLFTGSICGVKFNVNDIKTQILILISNLIGVVIAALLTSTADPTLIVKAHTIVNIKLHESVIVLITKAMLCNMWIYFAAATWPVKKSVTLTLFAVFAFVYCGFEHCIANAYYLAIAGIWNFKFLILNILGNAISGILMHRIKQLAS